MKKKQLIISVGREFGSGGHEIAQGLADHYGLPMYDHDLLKRSQQSETWTAMSWQPMMR